VADVRPRVLAILPALFPSTIIGVAKPLLRLHHDRRIVLDLTLQYLTSRRAVARADVVVLCHTIDPQYGVILDWARELGRPIIYEIDDDLLAVPDDIPGLAYLAEPARQAQLVACLRQADIVRVYSPALREKLSAYSANVSVVSGPLDWSLMRTPAPKRDGLVTIVYATGRTQDRVGAMLVAPLGRVLDRHPGVRLTVWGARHDALMSHPQVRSLPLVRDYDTFFERFSREGFDIGLAPLRDDEFHRGKSNNKFREYASCGIAGVYSDVCVYNTSVEHERTGLLVPNDDRSWESAISRVIDDPELRRGIAERGRAYAREHFNEAVTDAAWMHAIESVDRPARPGRAPSSHSGSSPGELDKALGLARFLGKLAGQVTPVLREHGVRVVVQRTWQHVQGLGQFAAWLLKRRQLERRINARRSGGSGPVAEPGVSHRTSH